MATSSADSGFTDDWQGERTLAECNLHMLKSADTCDVTFQVGQSEDIVHAHRYVLISRSCVFYSMLCGDWSKEESIKLPDVSKELFTEFLAFLYTDDCSLTADNVTGLLYLSKKYAVHRLHRLCLSFLQTNLTPENACVVLEQAHFFDEDQLFQQALKIVNTNFEKSMLTPGFRDLCHSCLEMVMTSSDLDLNTEPEVVFDCIVSWASAECSRQSKEVTPRNQRDVLGETVYLVGFTGFDAASFVQKVLPSQLLDDSECLRIMSNITCPDKDVGQFRIVDPKVRKRIHELQVYEEFNKSNDEEEKVFSRWSVNDTLDIRCDQKALLHGITLVPSEARYAISVLHAEKTILFTEYSTTVYNSKLDFPCSVVLDPGLTYRVRVRYLSGKCPPFLMKNSKLEVCSPNKKFYISRNYWLQPKNGMIMKLTVS